MRSQDRFLRRVILASVLLVAGGLIAAESRADETSALGSFDGVTTGFIENRGQVDEAVQYYAPGSRVTMYFTAEAVVFDLREEVREEDAGPAHHEPDAFVDQPASEPQARRGCAVWLRFEGANSSATIESRGELITRYNYFLGNDPDRWQANVPAYAEIVYHDLWPGIDLLFRNQGGRITYDVILAPSADPERIR
ncbi:MAG: hypothetical protein IMY80_01920, partial [Chloroflexi bacterium]|nr:hypothetical protein [Chloroflexota bacterium]